MAYQIKSIRYQNSPRKILLQNINGPCPLLAAANALLLRGVITLSSECIRNGVASTDDVVNMLANRALLRSQQQSSSKSSNQQGNNHEYHLNEVLSILPQLQHGMDVNPQFTSPQSIEYTHNLAALDLLGVELVHGWVLDPQDVDTCAVVEERSYNELIELVVVGGGEERKREVERLEGVKGEKEEELKRILLLLVETTEGISKGTEIEAEVVNKGEAAIDSEAETQTQTNNKDNDSVEVANIDANENDTKSSTTKQISSEASLSLHEQQAKLKQEIADISLEIEHASLQISRANVANDFLTSTSHQLTYHGLERLHAHIGDDAVHVFFRNNHFGTITKHNGILYLLVTDLGYANTPEIVWEKLDSIDGNTEYVNEYFEKPSPREELAPAAGPTIDPALLLAQRSQAESDYQLAMAMSRGETTAPTSSSSSQHASNNLDEEEGKLIDAAKELSLRTYHGETDAAVAVDTDNSNPPSAHNSQLDSDHQMALAFQREEERLNHESEQLARQLQALDEQEVALQRQRQQRNNTNRRRQPNSSRLAEGAKAGCTIS